MGFFNTNHNIDKGPQRPKFPGVSPELVAELAGYDFQPYHDHAAALVESAAVTSEIPRPVIPLHPNSAQEIWRDQPAA